MDVDEGKVNCHYCDETFASKDSAMKHWKEAHKEKVRQCIYWIQNHLDEVNEIKCKHCDEGFKLRSEFM